jgi:hypothetical protein
MKVIPLFLALIVALEAPAQMSTDDSVNRKRAEIGRAGMAVLGSWALLNIGSGLVAKGNSNGRQKQFYKTNVIWGGVNLLLAGVGYLRERGEHSYIISETFRKQAGTEKLFLFNTALDLGYVAFGLYLRERGNRFVGAKRERLLGTGDSFLVQGGFLFLFDGIMYTVHTLNGARLYPALKKISFFPSKNGCGLVYRF